LAERLVNSRIISPVIIKTDPKRLRQVVNEILPFTEEMRELLPRVFTPSIPSLSPYPLKVLRRFSMIASILPREIVFRLAENRNVERIFYDRPMYALGFPVVPDEGVFTAPHRLLDKITFTSTAWTKRLLGCDVAHEKGFFGRDVLVASADTGASRVHEQIRRVRMKTAMKQFRDENGHGTHITSTIGGVPMMDDYLSQRSRRRVFCEGMAPQCDLLAVKCLGFYQGVGSTSQIVDAVDIAITEGADIVNMSLGASSETETAEDDVFYEVFEEMIKADIIPVVASGNSGPKPETVGTPGGIPSALTVGAYNPITGELAPFSSRGPAYGDIVKPDVIAPGVEIDSGCVGVCDKAGDGVPSRYSNLSGTSMATPHIAGLVALMRESMKKRLGKVLTVDEIKRMMSELVGSKNNEVGWGILDWSLWENWLETEFGVEL